MSLQSLLFVACCAPLQKAEFVRQTLTDFFAKYCFGGLDEKNMFLLRPYNAKVIVSGQINVLSNEYSRSTLLTKASTQGTMFPNTTLVLRFNSCKKI